MAAESRSSALVMASGHMTRLLFIYKVFGSDIHAAEGRLSVPASRRLNLGSDVSQVTQLLTELEPALSGNVKGKSGGGKLMHAQKEFCKI